MRQGSNGKASHELSGQSLNNQHTQNKSGVLVINPGSSSLKWAYFKSLAASSASASGQNDVGKVSSEIAGLLSRYPVELIVIRFVHGGHDFVTPLTIDEVSFRKLRELQSLAPIHNQSSLLCSKIMSENAPGLRQIAVFDTEFFHTLPRVAQMYGLPRKIMEKYNIRRFGFHGFAHAGMLKGWHTLHGTGPGGDERLITVQLGSGCSMAAISNGRPIDCTMGFTPNDGLLMSTRCGDIDPGLLTWLQKKENWNPDQTDRILNNKSGWLGLSGVSSNMAELLQHDSIAARLAVNLFTYRIRKTIGAYYAVLGGLDGIIFSGGIPEHSPGFCKEILANLQHLGIDSDVENKLPILNTFSGIETYRLTSPRSPVACWSMCSNEARSMLDSVEKSLQ